MTKDETLKLALEALERCVATCFDPYAHEQAMSGSEHFVNQTITAIKEALAQTEQKPFAWYDPTNGMVSTDKDSPLFTPLGQVLPLYTKQEQEPVAIYRAGQTKGEVYHVQFLKEMAADEVLLYAAPVQRTWVGLKDKEIEEIWKIAMFTDYGIGAELSNQPFVHYAKAIEAKLKEKNG
jgi:hypothetical protein